jgi:hypothetical protein
VEAVDISVPNALPFSLTALSRLHGQRHSGAAHHGGHQETHMCMAVCKDMHWQLLANCQVQTLELTQSCQGSTTEEHPPET